jgi:hypothetical protein
MAGTAEPFGPFRDMDPCERTAQLRCLRTLVRTHWPLAELERGLRDCETDYGRLGPTLKLLDAVPTLQRRRILATFAALHYTSGSKGTTRSTSDDDRQDDRTGRAIGQTQASSPRP